MNLDDAIRRMENFASSYRAGSEGCESARRCAEEYAQIAAWLRELKERRGGTWSPEAETRQAFEKLVADLSPALRPLFVKHGFGDVIISVSFPEGDPSKFSLPP